ncbi:MAG: complex I subunit 5 family protein, partial [Firmicutes bacterium]|nr:complex I subunit 5 family protein [Bacillota bacterium]
FYLFLLATLASCIGVVLAGDLFTLFLFFEMMTFLSYVLVIHEQNAAAMHAGKVMLYLGVVGGLAILMGILMLYAATGTVDIKPLYDLISHTSLNPYTVMTLFLLGFGVKAGMVPLHIWLPKAHPVAPSPASALLSGLMIKAGAYGIFRVVGMIFTPAEVAHVATETAHAVEVIPSMNFGYVIIWIGIATMFIGALLALLSTPAKKILAYSSVSQMGYILMGVGVATYLGADGAMGFAGALYHIINHAFFKAGLFLMVGSVYMITHELDITVVRGMLKKVPFIAIVFLIAFAGIAGIPGFNGYVSKTLLHHAIVEAAEHSHSMPLAMAEKIFMLTSAMTVCYFAKLFRGLFLGKVPEKFDKKKYTFTWPVYAVLGFFGSAILAIGMFPHYLLNKMVIPAMQGFTYDIHVVDHLYEINVWNWHDAQGSVIVLSMAVVLFFVMDRSHFFSLKTPKWLSVEYLLYQPVMRLLVQTFCDLSTTFDSSINNAYLQSGRVSADICNFVTVFDNSLNETYEKSGGVARRLAERTEQFDNSLNDAYEKSGEVARKLADRTEQFDGALNDAYEKSGSVAKQMAQKTADLTDIPVQLTKEAGRPKTLRERLRSHPSDWNIKNLNFDSLLIALMLGLFLFVIIFYTRFN